MLTTQRGVTHLALEISCDWFIMMRITSRQPYRRSDKFLRLVINRTDELRTARIGNPVAPAELALRYPITPGVAIHVTDSRRRVEKVLNGEGRRLLVIIGPCSIHDLVVAMEYATRLQSLHNQYQLRPGIVMHTHFEKPRTAAGWEGLTSDPDLNGSYQVNHDLELAHKLLLQVNELDIPTATEFLDMVAGQFIADLISWGATGTRTAESQIHREMASALSCPVGFKNSTDGNTRIAMDAIRATRASHMFLSPGKNGQMTVYQTSDNPYSHIIMRGGRKPNYRTDDIVAACDTPHGFDLPEHLAVNFGHGNYQKQRRRQLEVCEDICQQIHNDSTTIVGIMVKGFLHEGTQKTIGGQPLIYSQSITDLRLGWEDTERLVEKLASAVDTRF